MEKSALVLAVIGTSETGVAQSAEFETALALHKRVIPVLVGGAGYGMLPPMLESIQALQLGGKADKHLKAADLEVLVDSIQPLLRSDSSASPTSIDPDDPQKGRWGGRPAARGRRLSAEVEAVGKTWFQVTLVVQATKDATEPLRGDVVFHLHPTFSPSRETVPVRDGRAELILGSYGAFTVGAIADDGRTTLELDLSKGKRFPRVFVES
jgi:hypothetical protein